MTRPTTMTLRDAGAPIGEIRDFGPGRVLAINFPRAGERRIAWVSSHKASRDAGHIGRARQRTRAAESGVNADAAR